MIYMTKNKPKLITFNPVLEDMASMLIKQKGYSNFQDVCRAGIIALYDDTFPPYKNVSLRGSDTEEDVVKRATMKAKSKAILEEQEELLKNEHKVKMCKRVLYGEVTDNDTCRYTQYTMTDDNVLEIPLAQVSPAIAENTMFLPSREAVLKNRKSVARLFAKYEEKYEK